MQRELEAEHALAQAAQRALTAWIVSFQQLNPHQLQLLEQFERLVDRAEEPTPPVRCGEPGLRQAGAEGPGGM